MERSMFGKNMTGVVYALGIAVLGASINNTHIVDTTYNLNNTYY